MTKAAPQIPDGLCLYAIGDIHGHKNRLEKLIGMIADDARAHPDATKRLVFLGDYIDRGPDSKGVIDFLLYRLPIGFERIFIRGNHEDVALRVLGGETEVIQSWMQFGGAAFLASYGVNPFRPRISETPEILQAELAAQMEPMHHKFLKDTVFTHVCGDYYFTHAGVNPAVDLDKQDSEDLMWIRQEFLGSKKDFGKTVVHGHSISIEPDIQPNRIGIDTGAYATGKLTALKLIGATQTFLTT